MSVTYREAQPKDVDTLLSLFHELAVYEKLTDMFAVTAADVQKLFFKENPRAFCLLAEHEGQAVGFCAYFYSFSTFIGKHGIYIHDVYVKENTRGLGVGKGFFREMARIAEREECCRIEWDVLNWNQPAIDFYDRLGAVRMAEWSTYRLEGDAIAKVANG